MKRTLPKKWCIERNTINYLAVNKWLNSTHKIGEGEYTDKRGWAFSERVNAGSHGRTDTDEFAPPYPAKSRFTPITFEEFKKFVLKETHKTKFPAKWCIERNPTNAKVLNDWANKTITNGGFTASEGWFYEGMRDWDMYKPTGYTTITLEQFKENVANKRKTRRTKEVKVIAPTTTVTKTGLPEKYVVKVDILKEKHEVASALKEIKWTERCPYNFVVWDKDNKGSALWNEIPSRAIGWPVFTYAEWKRLYYPKPTSVTPTAVKKITIEEIVARTTSTWIRCTTVEQGRKVGEYRNKDGASCWQDFDFSQYKEFYCYPYYNGASMGGWNRTPCDSSPVVDFNDVIFPIKATLPTEDFGIVAETHPNLVLDWFRDNGYNTNEWNGNAASNYIYFVKKDKKVDCDLLENYKNDIKGTIFTLTQIKEMTQKTQKIIGYKLIKEYPGFVGELGGVSKGTSYQFSHGRTENYTESYFNAEFWKPVYEEIIVSKEMNLGTPKRKFTIYKDKVVVLGGDNETRTFTTEHIKTLETMFTTKIIRSLDARVQSIQVGCSDGTSLTAADFDTIKRTQSSL